MARKYSSDGILDGDRIKRDLISFNLTTESRWHRYDYNRKPEYDEEESNSIILRYLYKVFVKFPKNFISGIFNFFKDIIVDTFREGEYVISIMMSIITIVLAVLLFILGVFIYEAIEHEMNGIESGVVNSTSFEPAHTEPITHVIIINGHSHTYITNEWVNDRWWVEIRDGKRVENWYSYNIQNASVGDTLLNDENWIWGETKDR
jgi:hypothetical protein